MKKSVYSLVLSDNVIAEIDRAAYSMNTSRSNLINQILADYVSYVTPEKRMKEIFERVENMLGSMDSFQLMLQPSDTMISLRSALAYKYNPTVKYSVELYKNKEGLEDSVFGELRVSLRTQSTKLILYIIQFFKLWAKIEEAYIGRTDFVIEDGRYLRKLHILPRNSTQGSSVPDNQVLGEIIANYIQVLDDSMKAYFSMLENPVRAAQEVEMRYREYLLEHKTVI